MELVDYSGTKIIIGNCPGCDWVNHEFSLPCGRIYEDDTIVVSQDWELPIAGFIVIATRRCVDSVEQLSAKERNHLFSYVSKCLKILRQDIGVCEEYNVIFEEKKGRHFHVWLMPRLEWMKQFGYTKNIGAIQNYAKENLRTKEEFDKIEMVTKKLSKSLSKRESTCLQK